MVQRVPEGFRRVCGFLEHFGVFQEGLWRGPRFYLPALKACLFQQMRSFQSRLPLKQLSGPPSFTQTFLLVFFTQSRGQRGIPSIFNTHHPARQRASLDPCSTGSGSTPGLTFPHSFVQGSPPTQKSAMVTFLTQTGAEQATLNNNVE